LDSIVGQIGSIVRLPNTSCQKKIYVAQSWSSYFHLKGPSIIQ